MIDYNSYTGKIVKVTLRNFIVIKGRVRMAGKGYLELTTDDGDVKTLLYSEILGIGEVDNDR